MAAVVKLKFSLRTHRTRGGQKQAAFPFYNPDRWIFVNPAAAWFPLLITMTQLIAVTTVTAGSINSQETPAEIQTAAAVDHFQNRVEPVLRANCYQCHSAEAASVQGGLRLDSRPGIHRGGDSGPIVVEGKPEQSLLLQVLRHENGLAMPPDSDRLPPQIIADFERWIKDGAEDPRSVEPDRRPSAEARQHWAFQPVVRPVPPAISNSTGLLNPIDAFITDRLQKQGWSPAPSISRSDWIRRVTFDLTGLPPTPAEIRTFLNDGSATAFETVADRLLENPHYGERQAQHWLDVIRYAETEGYEYDGHLPDAWRFRDYVISSFATDKSFKQFITEQIAGDELDPDNHDLQIASVFHRLGPVRRNAGNPDIALSRNEVLTERTDIIGSAFLALSIGCARCHDHKLEPILQKDYYRFQAYLAATEENTIRLASPEETAKWNTETSQLRAKQTSLRNAAKVATGEEKRLLEKRAEDLETQFPPTLPSIPGIRNDHENRTAIHVLKRGVWENKGDAVGPRPPEILTKDEAPELPADIANPRTRLAEWLVSEQNPLTARVIVNRVWQQHFGHGIVRTSNDFGTRGERPDHPELLDWLTSEFVLGDWKLKPLHRLIVLSSTYRQSHTSPWAADAQTSDPQNRLLWHMPRRRLTAEELRDSMLFVSGRLEVKLGGPSVMPPVDESLVRLLYKPSQWQVSPDTRDHDRRSIYLIAKRNLRLPFLEIFDAPALLTSCDRRDASTHAPQALELLNGTLSNDLARSFADRCRRECGNDQDALIRSAFLHAIGRQPHPKEYEFSVQFLDDQPLEEFALALFNLNEFVYVP